MDDFQSLGPATRPRSESLAVLTPATVFAQALGPDALVKWLVPNDAHTSKPTLKWIINRYRWQTGTWLLKGSFDVPFPRSIGQGDVFQAVAAGLKPDSLYRFTVQRVRSSGKDDESGPSNAVLVTPNLPDPWMPLFDETSDGCVFVHLRTKQQVASRPEQLPYFVEEDVRICFLPDELASFQSIFEDAMYHFGKIDVACMQRIFRQLGEVLEEKALEGIVGVATNRVEKREKLYRRLLRLSQVTSRKLRVTCFQEFVACLHMVKMQRVRRRALARRAWAHTWWAMYGAMVARNLRIVMQAALHENVLSGTLWQMFDDGKQPYFVNRVTNVIRWRPPDELYCYIPPVLQQQLERCLSVSEIETLKAYFSEVDFDGDGKISLHQLLAVLQAMQFYCDGFMVEHMIPMLSHKGYTRFDFKLVCWIFCVLRLFLSDDGTNIYVLTQPQLWPSLRPDIIKHVSKRKIESMLTSMYSNVEPPFYTPVSDTYPHGRVCLCGCRAHLVPQTIDSARNGSSIS